MASTYSNSALQPQSSTGGTSMNSGGGGGAGASLVGGGPGANGAGGGPVGPGGQKIDPEKRFIKQEKIGRGSFGEVFKGIDKQDNSVVAIKIIDLEEAEDEIEDIQQEIQVLSQCDSTFVTKYYGSFLKVHSIRSLYPLMIALSSLFIGFFLLLIVFEKSIRSISFRIYLYLFFYVTNTNTLSFAIAF